MTNLSVESKIKKNARLIYTPILLNINDGDFVFYREKNDGKDYLAEFKGKQDDAFKIVRYFDNREIKINKDAVSGKILWIIQPSNP